MSPLYHLRLFGGPELRREGGEIPLSPLQACLLSLLYAQSGEGLPRTEVLARLWPGEEEARSRKRLNQLLYSLKRRTGTPPPFESRHDGAIVQSPRVGSDLPGFEEHVRAGDLQGALALCEKGFLVRLIPGPSEAFADWAQGKRLALLQLLRRRAAAQVSSARAEGDWRRAREAAEVLLAIDPNDEDILREVVKARARGGGIAEAEAAVRSFGNRIREENGEPWTPSMETKELLEDLRTASDDAELPEILRTSPDVPNPPLSGRDDVLLRLRKTLRAVPEETIQVSLVLGEAGMGKTRLIQEALNGIHLDGYRVLGGDTAELEKLIPLNPLLEAFRDPAVTEVLKTLGEPWRTVLYGVMPRHYPGGGEVPDAPSIQPGSVPRRLYEAFNQLLLVLVEDRPLVLVLENLHWADETSLSILEFLTRRWTEGRLHLLLSMREEEVDRNPNSRTFLESLRNHHGFLEISLEDLDQQACDRLVRELTTAHLEKDDVSALHSLAGGNPFFLIELTLEFLAGRIRTRQTPAGVVTIPLSIRQVLQRRLTHLSGDAEAVLSALAVYGRPLHLRDLARVSQVPVARCVTGLEQLQEYRLIRSTGSHVGVRHELIRHSVYQELSDSRRAWLHGRVADDLMEREGESPPDDLALHFHHAGETDKAYHYATEAASRAESTGAIPEALRYLEIAREHTDDPEAAATLIGRMGHLHYLHQDLEEAAPLLELAAQRFRKQGKLSEALEAELERIDCLAKTNLLPLRECLEELEEIKKEAREQGEQSSFVKALDVEVNHRARVGDLEMIRKVLRQARRESGSGTNRTECRVQSILALNIYFACPEIGIRAAREAVRKGLSTNDDELILNALNRLILALHHQGLLNTDEGRDTLAKAEGRLETCGDLILKFFIRLNYAVWCLEIGDVAAADLAFRKAGRVIRGSKAQEAKAMLHLNLGEMELCLHGYENARHHYFSAENLIPETSPPFYHTIVNAGLGQCALHNGELTEARKREEMIGELPSFWSYDPTVVVGFKARMLLKRGEGRAAKELLLDAANSVRDRFIPAWLRLYIDFHRLERRLGDPISTHLLEEARDIATNLHLHERARQTKHLLQDSQSLR